MRVSNVPATNNPVSIDIVLNWNKIAQHANTSRQIRNPESQFPTQHLFGREVTRMHACHEWALFQFGPTHGSGQIQRHLDDAEPSNTRANSAPIGRNRTHLNEFRPMDGFGHIRSYPDTVLHIWNVIHVTRPSLTLKIRNGFHLELRNRERSGGCNK